MIISVALGFLSLPLLAQAQPATGTLQMIRETGRIRIGHRLSSVPFSYLNDAGEPVGYAIDLCLKIVESLRISQQLPDLTVEYLQVDTQTRIPLVANGSVDLECGSTTNTLSRQEEVSFSPITFITGVKLLVKQDAGITGIADMAGKTIGVLPDTSTERVISSIVQEQGIDARIFNQIADHDEGFVALQENLIDAYVTDDILLFGLRQGAADPNAYAVVGEFLSYEPYGIMLRRNDADFELEVNRALSQLFRSGEIVPLYQKWFNPLGVELTSDFEAAIRLQALPE
ncbi:MAG: amino acid ABC transporter substrate-binding protein [Synechococcaceae cyanobacterium SM2_3_1]|nr:amino acid ABC transporter substrate-binding protein [Synechococcaceae cyanobacterium SM2_3_1]